MTTGDLSICKFVKSAKYASAERRKRAGGHANDFKQTAASPVSPLAYNVSLIAAMFAVVTRYPFTTIILYRNRYFRY